MKTPRILPFLLCLAAGAALSWVSIYAFWFAAWFFHSVPAVRACDAIAAFLLLPARYIFQWMGADQSAIFFDPRSFAGTNGLVLGIAFYAVFQEIRKRRANGKRAATAATAANAANAANAATAVKAAAAPVVTARR